MYPNIQKKKRKESPYLTDRNFLCEFVFGIRIFQNTVGYSDLYEKQYL